MGFTDFRLCKLSSGFALIPAILITSLLLIIGLFFLTSTISEKRISESHSISQQSYYLAESGIEYAIWKLKNNTEWETNFETDPSWTQNYTGGSTLFANGSYDIFIENYDLAKANIIATSTLSIGKRTSQRVIKTKIFKALGGSSIDNNAIFADRDINISSGSVVNVNNGSIFANEDITVNFVSSVDVQDKIQAAGNIYEIISWHMNANEIHATNFNPPAPAKIAMPAIDFDSSESNSFKSLAQTQGQYYTNAQFKTLLNNNPTLVLNGVIYVTGNIRIENGHNLTVNGVLATNGRIDVGENKHWWASCELDSAELTISHINGAPSGIFTKNNITFNQCVNSVNINGVVYANNSIDLYNTYCSTVLINGSTLSRDITIFLLPNGITINYDNQAVIDTLGVGEYSPVITVEYWEEEY